MSAIVTLNDLWHSGEVAWWQTLVLVGLQGIVVWQMTACQNTHSAMNCSRLFSYIFCCHITTNGNSMENSRLQILIWEDSSWSSVGAWRWLLINNDSRSLRTRMLCVSHQSSSEQARPQHHTTWTLSISCEIIYPQNIELFIFSFLFLL